MPERAFHYEDAGVNVRKKTVLKMYTHARQFPHFAGMSDEQIRAVVRRAVDKNRVFRSLRVIQISAWFVLLVTITVLSLLVGLELGVSLGVAGFSGALFVLGWNFVWLNTALYRITREEMLA